VPAVPVGSSPLLNTFELDGNAVTGTLGTSGSTVTSHDWDQVFNDFKNGTSTSGAADSVFIPDVPSPLATPPDNSLTGGATKDVNDIGQWIAVSAAVPQAKNDMNDAYGAAYLLSASNIPVGYTGPDKAGDLLLYTGSDRINNNGDAAEGFWFLQKQVVVQNGSFVPLDPTTGNPAPGSPVHTAGDILVVEDFGNGGASAAPVVFEWSASNTLVQITGSFGSDALFSTANESKTAIPSPWPFTPKSGASNMFAQNEFVEGAVDLNVIFSGSPTGHIPTSMLPCFSAFLAETRTSEAPTATLSDYALGTLDTCADVAVTKTADHAVVTAGQQVGFTVTVTSDGLGTANNVTLTDTLPAGAGHDIVWSIPSGGNPSGDFVLNGTTAGSQSLTLLSGTSLASGTSISVHIVGTSTAADAPTNFTGSITNTATVNIADDMTPADNTSTASITINSPDVDIKKIADQTTVNTGDPVGFTLIVTNEGKADATGVTLTDALSAGEGNDIVWTKDTTYGTPSAFVLTGTTAGSQTLTLAASTLTAGSTIEVHITGTAGPNDCGSVSNTASVTVGNEMSPESSGDPESVNVTLPGGTSPTAVTLDEHSSTATITVNCPDVDMLKTADSSSILFTDTSPATQTVGFTLTITNEGTGTAKNVVLTDPLPGGVDIVWTKDTSAVGTTPSAFVLNGTTAGSQSLTLASSTLAAGQTISVHITGTATPTDCGPLTNTASVTVGNEPSPEMEHSGSTDTLPGGIPLGEHSSTATITIDKLLHTVLFDPTGSGSTQANTAVNVRTFDQGPGNALSVGALPGVNSPGGTDFQTLFQSTMSALLVSGSKNHIASLAGLGNPGPNGFQILTEANFRESGFLSAPGTISLSNPTTPGANFFQIVYHPLPDATTLPDDLTGAGYTPQFSGSINNPTTTITNSSPGSTTTTDRVILTGHIVNVIGVAQTTGATTSPLDPFQAPGSTNPPTLVFSGSTTLNIAVDYANPLFFPDPSQQLTSLTVVTTNVTAFSSVDANAGKFFTGPTSTTPYARQIGATNGATGPDVEFQSDASTSVVVTCSESSPTITMSSSGNGQVHAGTTGSPGTNTYTITVSNSGPNAITNARVTDVFPQGITGVSWTATPASGATVGTSSGTSDISSIVNLPVNSTVTFTVTATLSPLMAAYDISGLLSNTATVTTGSNVTRSATATDTLVFPMLAVSTGSGAVPAPLTAQQLQPVLNEAIANWAASGLDPQSASTLQHVSVHIANLTGAELGLASPYDGQIWISPNAAGWGWSTNTSASPAAGQMDLLTVVEHELGHILGFDDESVGSGVMEAALMPGVRLSPDSLFLAADAAANVPNPSFVPSPGTPSPSIPVSAPAIVVTTTGIASAPAQGLPSVALVSQAVSRSEEAVAPAMAPLTPSSNQVASLPSASVSVSGALSAVGLAPILIGLPGSSFPVQTPPVPSGRLAVTTNGVNMVGPDVSTTLMPLPVDTRWASGGGDSVLGNEQSPVNEGPAVGTSSILASDHTLRRQAMPVAPTVAVEGTRPPKQPWIQACEAYLAEEDWADRGPVAAPAQDGDEPAASTLDRIATLAAVFAVALRSYRAINPRTPRGVSSDRSGMRVDETSAPRRRSGPLSR
jgi:uncharacterized repeat protein (TIGR01451 family)